MEIDASGDSRSIRMPADARPGDTIHVVYCVTEGGNGYDEHMVNYARVILTITQAVCCTILYVTSYDALRPARGAIA